MSATEVAAQPTPPRAVPARPAEAPGSDGVASVDRAELRALVRAEVQAAVRAEMLGMVKSVLGDLFKEKMMPKLLTYGQERVQSIVTRDLQAIMERRVDEELARFSDD